MKAERVLLIGYGNPGRLDDGLGPACAGAVERLRIDGVTVDSNYQLTVEDAAQIAGYDVVVFADASLNGPEPFGFKTVFPFPDAGFTTHSVEPEAVLALAQDMFGARTRGFALAIRGYEFNEFGERLSAAARRNLKQAVDFIAGVIETGAFDRYAHGAQGVAERPAVRMQITAADMN